MKLNWYKRLFAGAKMNFALLGFRIHKMNLQEVKFVIKLRCYNPSKAPITLAINQIVANYKGSAIAYSTPDIKGLTIEAGKTQEPEIKFDILYLNLMGSGLNLNTLSNTAQLKKDLTFTMTLSINGETITTTQSLTDETHSSVGSLNSSENKINMKQHMNGLALGELGPLIYIVLLKRLNRFLIIKLCFAIMILSGVIIALFGISQPWIFALLLFPATIASSCICPPGTNLMLEQQNSDTGAASALITAFVTIMGSIGIIIVSLDLGNLVEIVGIINIIILISYVE